VPEGWALHGGECMGENARASDSEEEPVHCDDSLPNLEDQTLSEEAKLTTELLDFVADKVMCGQQEH